MSPICDCCSEHVNILKQQVSVMRKEIKNLRQMLDTATRTHRKHMLSIQSAVSKVSVQEPEKALPPPPPASCQAALEHGIIQTVPIGYISSCFSVKNGTPRQPTVCGPSRAELRLKQSVFNNPEHALLGLEQYSHVWVIFIFHKNGHMHYKAKVKPPRLNGQRVGVYSTRSPHRPNALGLTLAKLDKIDGDTLHISNIDMIEGTPVLDIKPYIPDYDSPCTRISIDCKSCQSSADQSDCIPLSPNQPTEGLLNVKDVKSVAETPNLDGCKFPNSLTEPGDTLAMLEEMKAYLNQSDLYQGSCDHKHGASDLQGPEQDQRPCYREEAYSTIAGWIREPPVSSLEVRFTPHAERELAEFLPTGQPGPPKSDRPRFKFLHSSQEAATAIRGVLSADPRSVYRRTRCKDKLFFFTLDTADITCWFGQGFVEVLQVRPIQSH
uniref:tRNA (adenine(37)-N6)-methyltransferase n=1 Tax=Doryrhamphus excisus TaxID=161450 RepID=UPI0025AE6ED9|nr:tRNA (adenine(37)-N6)-methyltransferase [Doryrhamphus excisus]